MIYVRNATGSLIHTVQPLASRPGKWETHALEPVFVDGASCRPGRFCHIVAEVQVSLYHDVHGQTVRTTPNLGVNITLQTLLDRVWMSINFGKNKYKGLGSGTESEGDGILVIVPENLPGPDLF
jgi:hypothetical protein